MTCPHPQVRLIIWYSVTLSAAGGISKHLHGTSDPARGPGQVRAAPAARARLNDPGTIRPGGPRQARPRMAFLPALRPARPRPPCLPLAAFCLRRRAVLAGGLR